MARAKKPEIVPEIQPATTPHLNIDDMQLEELIELKTNVDLLIKKKQNQKKKELFAEMSDMAKAAGYTSVAEFIASQSGSRAIRSDKGVKLPPKYQSKDKQKTWSGKGRKPDWVIKHLAGGGNIEALEIK
ncbi:MAG: H-NS histone family protein [Magnetococcales bacterium]|nr:H-NS histone family protein [Magnetococcales bacterium]